jgi:hypothetical protein
VKKAKYDSARELQEVTRALKDLEYKQKVAESRGGSSANTSSGSTSLLQM